MNGKWEQHEGYQEIAGKECKITLEPRPAYCDRGNFLAKLFGDVTSEEFDPGFAIVIGTKEPRHLEIDDQDGWPRYYFDETRAKLEIEAWLTKRGQL